MSDEVDHYLEIVVAPDHYTWTYDQVWHDVPVGEILNELLRRGLTRGEAAALVMKAQAEAAS